MYRMDEKLKNFFETGNEGGARDVGRGVGELGGNGICELIIAKRIIRN